MSETFLLIVVHGTSFLMQHNRLCPSVGILIEKNGNSGCFVDSWVLFAEKDCLKRYMDAFQKEVHVSPHMTSDRRFVAFLQSRTVFSVRHA